MDFIEKESHHLFPSFTATLYFYNFFAKCVLHTANKVKRFYWEDRLSYKWSFKYDI